MNRVDIIIVEDLPESIFVVYYIQTELKKKPIDQIAVDDIQKNIKWFQMTDYRCLYGGLPKDQKNRQQNMKAKVIRKAVHIVCCLIWPLMSEEQRSG
ncbi:MAG: hypothetical protein OEX02_11630 [Cyclobacteriaceae bacterium]|nr:hypothetical protein [Cyclobacteriaceae bacterium]